AGAAVVGDGDDGGQVAGDPAQRRERGRQAHAAAEGDDLGLGMGTVAPAAQRPDGAPAPARRLRCPALPDALSCHPYSRPMSRWTTTVSIPSAASRRASRSDMATLRCLPPVQPTAMVTYRLPSRR